LIILTLIIATACSLAVVTKVWPFAGGASQPPLQLIGDLPYWNIAADSGNVVSTQHFDSVTPWMYGIDSKAGIVSLVPSATANRVDEGLTELRQANVPLTPTISNIRNGSWDYPTIIAMMRDPARRNQHVADIVNLARLNGYSGIDIDYEDLHAADRNVFTAFIVQLADALHAAKKTLSVDVFAKASDQGYDQRNVAQDYRALGRAADSIRIMAYDWHWANSEPGAVAPIGWVRSVLDYAVTQIPAHKITLGIPAYGYDWVGNKGHVVSWLQCYGIEQKYGATVQWDNNAQSPWLTYRSADGKRHVVWFENSYSTLAKLALARSMHIGGAYIWLAGDEDDLMWKRLSPKDIDQAEKTAARQSAGTGP
jgi:spore germination protein